jgi:hypothetical protein
MVCKLCLGMHLFKTRAAGDVLVVSLSFQLPAIDGFGTGFLILRVIFFFLSAFNVSFTAFRSSSPDLEDARASPFPTPFAAILAAAECLAGGQKDCAGII